MAKSRMMYHYTNKETVLLLKTFGFQNFSPEKIEELGLCNMFGPGVYLTSTDTPGPRVQVIIKTKKVVFLDYNNPESVKSFITLVNEVSRDIDSWDIGSIAYKLRASGYDALEIKVDFNKLSTEDLEAGIENIFGIEHQLLVFDANDTEVIP